MLFIVFVGLLTGSSYNYLKFFREYDTLESPYIILTLSIFF